MTDRQQHPIDTRPGTEAPAGELADRDRLLSAIVESSDYAIVTHTLAGVITSWNQAAERLYEYATEEAVGRHYAFVVPEELHGEADAILARIGRGESIGHFETVRVTRGGRRIDVALSISPVKALDGTVMGVAKIARDISEQKRLGEQLLASQKMETVGKLAGGVAHDINNILMIIVMQADLMLADFPPEHPARVRVQGIIGAVDRGSALIRQLLAFSRRQPIEPRLTEMNALVERFAAMLSRALPANIEVVTRLGDAVWPIFADPSRIEQAVLNLALNGRDAMPRGGRLTLETRNVVLDRAGGGLPPGDYVELRVSDTGTGIAPEHLPRVFDPFFTTKAPGSGSGLGLATCHGIVSQAGGVISASSAPGAGTVFRVLLPRSRAGADVPEAAAARAQTPPTSGTILLAEDEPMVRDTIARILTSAGYTVVSAASGNEAKRLVDKHRGGFDMVLTDIIMPNGTGRDLAEFLSDAYPAIKVVFMSGYTDDPLVNDGGLRRSRGWQVLHKPFRPQALLAVVRAVLATSDDAGVRSPAA